MDMDPAEFFKQLAEAQEKVADAQSRAEYHYNRFKISMMEYSNECRNPNCSPADLDTLRNKAHDQLDQLLDTIAEPRQIAENFNKSP